jgi:hypothetical protein
MTNTVTLQLTVPEDTEVRLSKEFLKTLKDLIIEDKVELTAVSAGEAVTQSMEYYETMSEALVIIEDSDEYVKDAEFDDFTKVHKLLAAHVYEED